MSTRRVVINMDVDTGAAEDAIAEVMSRIIEVAGVEAVDVAATEFLPGEGGA